MQSNLVNILFYFRFGVIGYCVILKYGTHHHLVQITNFRKNFFHEFLVLYNINIYFMFFGIIYNFFIIQWHWRLLESFGFFG